RLCSGAEQAVRLVVGAGGEEQRVGRAGVATVAEADAPQAVDFDRLMVGALHNAVLFPAVLALVERVDPAVAEVADQQIAAELAEVRRRHGKAPRGIQLALRGDAAVEGPVSAEHAYVAKAFARQLLVRLGRVLLRVRDEDLTADGLDPERRVPGGNAGIREVAGEIAAAVAERRVEDVDPRCGEGRSVKVVVSPAAGDREAEIDRVGRRHRADRVRRVHRRVPSGNLTVIRRKAEYS